MRGLVKNRAGHASSHDMMMHRRHVPHSSASADMTAAARRLAHPTCAVGGGRQVEGMGGARSLIGDLIGDHVRHRLARRHSLRGTSASTSTWGLAAPCGQSGNSGSGNPGFVSFGPHCPALSAIVALPFLSTSGPTARQRVKDHFMRDSEEGEWKGWPSNRGRVRYIEQRLGRVTQLIIPALADTLTRGQLPT